MPTLYLFERNAPIVVVFGSRSYRDARTILSFLIREIEVSKELTDEPPVIVHGACPKGADAIADVHAKALGLKVIQRPADWGRYGISAGPKRNEEIAVEFAAKARTVAGFWDGNSPGTKDAMLRFMRKGCAVEIFPENWLYR